VVAVTKLQRVGGGGEVERDTDDDGGASEHRVSSAAHVDDGDPRAAAARLLGLVLLRFLDVHQYVKYAHGPPVHICTCHPSPSARIRGLRHFNKKKKNPRGDGGGSWEC
jgi:hypothetical protein